MSTTLSVGLLARYPSVTNEDTEKSATGINSSLQKKISGLTMSSL